MIDFANVLDSSQTTTDACTPPVSEHSKFCRCCHKTYFTSRISALKNWYPSSRLDFKPHLASRIPHSAKPMLDPPRIPVRFTWAGFYRCSTLNVGGPIFMD